MLMAISEEKENRMIETMRSMVTSQQLIWGKLLAMVGLAFTQLVALATYGILAYQVSSKILPIHIDWSLVHLGVWQVVLTVYFIVAGFSLMAALMVGIGAAMPSYRDAQQASPLFIITSILPIYFGSIILADPSGLVSRITSYVPFMSPLVLTFRASVGAMPWWEQIIGIIVTALYAILGFIAAFKLFDIGALEVSKKISLKYLWRRE
jgi:ABC-2 type transport system permease protein